MDNDTSYESFLKYQEAGLKASNIPKKLWKEPFTKFPKFFKITRFFRHFGHFIRNFYDMSKTGNYSWPFSKIIPMDIFSRKWSEILSYFW